MSKKESSGICCQLFSSGIAFKRKHAGKKYIIVRPTSPGFNSL
jgi:hypothetical protein